MIADRQWAVMSATLTLRLLQGLPVSGRESEPSQSGGGRCRLITEIIRKQQAIEASSFSGYCSFAYSALACFRMGMSASESFQRVRKSL
jgi:hypothetical protein